MVMNEGITTFTANGALGAKIRVKITAASSTTPPQVEVAGAGEQHIGITEYAVASGKLVAVRLRTQPGTHESTASEALAVGATLYGAAAGKIADTSSGTAIGISLEAATATGDIIEFIDFTVISTTAATVSIADAGSHTSETTVEAALQEIYQDLLSIQHCIPIPLMTLMESDATNVVDYLGKATTPILDMKDGDTDSVMTVTWADADQDPIIMQAILPPGFTPGSDLVLHIRAAMQDTNDTPVLDIDTYFNEGDTKVSDASGAITGTAYAEYTATIANADIPAGAQTVTIELTPAAHANDEIYVTALWLEYERTILTS